MGSDGDPLDLDMTSMRGRPIPAPLIVYGAAESNLEWHNEIGGLTFDLGERYAKWNPRGNGIDLEREWQRLGWISTRHPAPKPLDWGADDDGQWMITETVPGRAAVGDKWRSRTGEAIAAIAMGLRAIHAIPIDDFPSDWPAQVWVARCPKAVGPRPPMSGPVLVHGDACIPNTLIADDGTWTGTSISAISPSAICGQIWPSPP